MEALLAMNPQTAFYILSPLVALLALYVTYTGLVKQSRPHILVYYRPNPGIQTMIDLVIENIGGGAALQVRFSRPLPVQCFGIKKSSGDSVEVLSEGLPIIGGGQQFIFDGGQYGGLLHHIDKGFEIEISYQFVDPFGFKCKRNEKSFLSISHLEHMPTRTNADAAIVDALKGSNITTLHKIEKGITKIGQTLDQIRNQLEKGKES